MDGASKTPATSLRELSVHQLVRSAAGLDARTGWSGAVRELHQGVGDEGGGGGGGGDSGGGGGGGGGGVKRPWRFSVGLARR